jgi:HK97 family phage major capsid protein
LLSRRRTTTGGKVALYDNLKAKKTALRAEADAIHAAAEAAGGWTDEQRTRDDEIAAELATVSADLDREERRLRTAPAVEQNEPASARIQVGADRALAKPWGHDFGATALLERAKTIGTPQVRADYERRAAEVMAGEQFIAVWKAATGQGFDPRLVQADPDDRISAAAQGMGRAVGVDGGFLIGTTVADDVKLRMTSGQIYRRVTPIPLDPGTDNVEINMLDETSMATGSRYGAVRGYWLDEGTAPTASRPKFRKYSLRARGLAALGYATNNLLNNVAALGNVMLTAFGQELKFLAEDAILNGSGAGMPKGILRSGSLVTISKETNQAAATVLVTNLSKMWARTHDDAKLSPNTIWLINTDVNPQLDELALPVGTGGLEPRFVRYDEQGILRIKGKEVVSVPYCATLGTVGDVVLVNLDEYGLIEQQMQSATSMHVAFTTERDGLPGHLLRRRRHEAGRRR